MPENNKRVLIVEDEPAILYSLKKIMAEAGYQVTTAEDGEKGLNMIKNDRPDLILLDIMLPKVNGFDIMEFIKKEEATKNIPVMVLTNLNDPDSIKRSVALGAAGHLIKTETRPQEILAHINKILKKGEENNSPPPASA